MLHTYLLRNHCKAAGFVCDVQGFIVTPVDISSLHLNKSCTEHGPNRIAKSDHNSWNGGEIPALSLYARVDEFVRHRYQEDE